jgi:hypothetical protein
MDHHTSHWQNAGEKLQFAAETSSSMHSKIHRGVLIKYTYPTFLTLEKKRLKENILCDSLRLLLLFTKRFGNY